MGEVALRDNSGKPELSFLLDLPRSLEALVKVFEQGAIKYARGNWQKGGKPDQEYLDSALRHLFAIPKDGYDPDTGCLHAAHVMWNMAALIELNYAPCAPLDPNFDQAAFVAKYTKQRLAAEPAPHIVRDGLTKYLVEGPDGIWKYE